MAMERVSVRLPLRVLADSSIWTLSCWLVEPGSTVYRNQRVAALHSPSTGAVDHALAPRAGTLVRTLVAKGASANGEAQSPTDFNRAIAEIEFCPHSVVFSGLCGVCGEEVAVAHFADVQADAAARLPVAYNASTLSVTRAEAESIASTTARQLLSQRRLSLVLDLDHTLVHATDDPRAAAVLGHSPDGTDMSSVASFSLPPMEGAEHVGPMDNRMHLKLRPHLFEFLSRCAKLFELHIYTMGSRLYADRVAQLIDPDKRLFSGRITSREDFEEGRSNQKNISRLFPCDDSMVLIIDDREDVWVSGTGASFMPNLIRAKPYTFWNGLHETYDRAMSAGSAEMTPAPSSGAVQGKAALLSKTVVQDARREGTADCAQNRQVEDNQKSIPLNDAVACIAKSPRKVTIRPASQEPPSLAAVEALGEEPMPALSEELRKLVNQWWENDSAAGGWNTHLRRLADVLEACHGRFFDKAGSAETEIVSVNGAMNGQGVSCGDCVSRKSTRPLTIFADVKSILAGIRLTVLEGCVITFTGVIALNIPPEQSTFWELAARHGAECRKEFVVGETTHVVASAERGLGTEKALAAMESGTSFIVDVAWLEDSSMQFERRPELLYHLGAPVVCNSWKEHRCAVSTAYDNARAERLAEISRITDMELPESTVAAKSGAANGASGEVRGCRQLSEEQKRGSVRPFKYRKMEKPHGDIQIGASKGEDGGTARILGEDEMDDVMLGLL